MAQVNHSMKVVTQRTGLSPHVIRVWERRYGAVTPGRTDTNRRLYSEDEVQRLILLRRATNAGHSIRNVANLSTPELGELVGEGTQEQPMDGKDVRPAPRQSSAASLVDQALTAVARLDAEGLEKALNRGAVELGQQALLQQVIVPLIEEIGNRWQRGALKVAHEHIATAVIRTFLGNFSRGYTVPSSAPGLIVTTPAGQLHELGAILVAAAANQQGWRVTYLGPSLPAEEIAGAVIQDNARAVALSVVYPEDDPHLDAELRRLRHLLPSEVFLLVGGRAAHCYRSSLLEIAALELPDIPSLYTLLERLRRNRKKSD